MTQNFSRQICYEAFSKFSSLIVFVFAAPSFLTFICWKTGNRQKTKRYFDHFCQWSKGLGSGDYKYGELRGAEQNEQQEEKNS